MNYDSTLNISIYIHKYVKCTVITEKGVLYRIGNYKCGICIRGGTVHYNQSTFKEASSRVIEGRPYIHYTLKVGFNR